MQTYNSNLTSAQQSTQQRQQQQIYNNNAFRSASVTLPDDQSSICHLYSWYCSSANSEVNKLIQHIINLTTITTTSSHLSTLSSLEENNLITSFQHRVDLLKVNNKNALPSSHSLTSVTSTASSTTTTATIPTRDEYRVHLSSPSSSNIPPAIISTSDSYYVNLLSSDPHICRVEQSIDSFIDSLTNVNLRQTITISGDEIDLGDFIVRIGLVRIGAIYQNCVFMEVEMKNNFLVTTGSSNVILEFTANILTNYPNSASIIQSANRSNDINNFWPKFTDYQLPGLFTKSHHALLIVLTIQSIQSNVAISSSSSAAPPPVVQRSAVQPRKPMKSLQSAAAMLLPTAIKSSRK